MSNFSKAILIAFGTIFCVVGSLALFRPDLLTEPVQITLPTASAKAEFRAAYGGMFLGLSAAAIGAVRQPHHAPFVVMILVIVLGVFSVARSLSLLIDGSPNYFSSVMHLVESGGFFLLVVVFRKLPNN